MKIFKKIYVSPFPNGHSEDDHVGHQNGILGGILDFSQNQNNYKVAIYCPDKDKLRF